MKQSFEEQVRQIELVFYNERAIRREVADIREDPCTKQNIIKSVGLITDPTGNKAIKQLTPIEKINVGTNVLEKPEIWLEVIDQVYQWSRGLTRAVAISRYRKNFSYVKSCIEFAISADTYYKRLKEFRNYALLQSANKQLIMIF